MVIRDIHSLCIQNKTVNIILYLRCTIEEGYFISKGEKGRLRKLCKWKEANI